MRSGDIAKLCERYDVRELALVHTTEAAGKNALPRNISR